MCVEGNEILRWCWEVVESLCLEDRCLVSYVEMVVNGGSMVI